MTVAEGQEKYAYTPLEEPIPITEQEWPEGTMPLVHTRTMTYMHEGFIRDCIEGILMQKTTFPVRVLIHDDASTDKTPSIVREYEKRYPHLISACYQNENTYRMNREEKVRRKKPFMDLCVGKYEAICEGDDYWTDPLKLQKQVSFMENNEDYSMCFHNANVIFDNSDSLLIFKDLETRLYSMEEILREWTIPTASVVFRRDLYDHNKARNKNYIYGDIILFLNLASRGKVYCINEIMSVYRRHKGGVTAKQSKSRVEWRKRFIQHHKEIQKNFSNLEDIENEIISKAYMNLSYEEIKCRDIRFVTSLLKSFITKPGSYLDNLRNVYLNKILRSVGSDKGGNYFK